MLADDRDASVVIRIFTASGIQADRDISRGKFSLLFSTNGNVCESKTKSGEKLLWDDYFYYNLRDLQKDDLIITLLMDGREIGSTKLTYKKIKKEFGLNRQSNYRQYIETQLILQNEDKKTGKLQVEIQRYRGEQIVGGIEPPTISLKPGVQLDDSFEFQPTERGIQRIRTAKLNLFSCMDGGDLGRQFMPQKFKSKTLDKYLIQSTMAKAGIESASGQNQQ